jgi:transcriptional regulator with XRE-family HTH domain
MLSRIRLERLRRGLSQLDLWSLCGIPQWRISLIENGMPPRPDERKKLSEALDIPEDAVDRKVGVED